RASAVLWSCATSAAASALTFAGSVAVVVTPAAVEVSVSLAGSDEATISEIPGGVSKGIDSTGGGPGSEGTIWTGGPAISSAGVTAASGTASTGSAPASPSSA